MKIPLSITEELDRSMIRPDQHALRRVMTELKKSNNFHDLLLVHYLSATWYCGLSPSEWENARLVDGKIVTTNPSMEGTVLLYLCQLHPSGQRIVRALLEMLDECRNNGISVERMFRRFRSRLSYIQRAMKPCPNITLTSSRWKRNKVRLEQNTALDVRKIRNSVPEFLKSIERGTRNG